MGSGQGAAAGSEADVCAPLVVGAVVRFQIVRSGPNRFRCLLWPGDIIRIMAKFFRPMRLLSLRGSRGTAEILPDPAGVAKEGHARAAFYRTGGGRGPPAVYSRRARIPPTALEESKGEVAGAACLRTGISTRK